MKVQREAGPVKTRDTGMPKWGRSPVDLPWRLAGLATGAQDIGTSLGQLPGRAPSNSTQAPPLLVPGSLVLFSNLATIHGCP